MTRQTRCTHCGGSLLPDMANDHYGDLTLACLLCGRESLTAETAAAQAASATAWASLVERVKAAPKHRGGRPRMQREHVA